MKRGGWGFFHCLWPIKKVRITKLVTFIATLIKVKYVGVRRMNTLASRQKLKRYRLYNENLWLDGFILDFLQKKLIDACLRRYFIFT